MVNTIVLYTFSFITRCFTYVSEQIAENHREGMKLISSCIGLLDRFLQKSILEGPAGFVTQKNLQLIAVATFLIAAKVEVNLSDEFVLKIR